MSLKLNYIFFSPEHLIQFLRQVPKSFINKLTPKTRLQLKNKQNQICATIDLEQAEQINTNLTASLLIYWDLKFADAGVETPVI